MADVGRKIKEAREYLGMTQEELAKKLGYRGKAAISKIETGVADISQTRVEEFAKALNTTPAFLMGWVGEDADIRPLDLFYKKREQVKNVVKKPARWEEEHRAVKGGKRKSWKCLIACFRPSACPLFA